MSEAATAASTESRMHIRVFINDQPFFAPEPSMTGAEILTLASLPAGNQLFLEVPGPGEDRPIRPEERVKLQPGMKFYDVPVGTFG